MSRRLLYRAGLFWSTAGYAGNRRRAINMERLDGLEPPGLPLLALGLGPADGLPVGRQDQARAGIGDLHTIAAGLIDVQEKGLLDGVFVRASLDFDPVLQENVGGEQHFLT